MWADNSPLNASDSLFLSISQLFASTVLLLVASLKCWGAWWHEAPFACLKAPWCCGTRVALDLPNTSFATSSAIHLKSSLGCLVPLLFEPTTYMGLCMPDELKEVTSEKADGHQVIPWTLTGGDKYFNLISYREDGSVDLRLIGLLQLYTSFMWGDNIAVSPSPLLKADGNNKALGWW